MNETDETVRFELHFTCRPLNLEKAVDLSQEHHWQDEQVPFALCRDRAIENWADMPSAPITDSGRNTGDLRFELDEMSRSLPHR